MRFSTSKGLASLPWYLRLPVAAVFIPFTIFIALFYAARDAAEEFISCYVWEELPCMMLAMMIGSKKYNEIQDSKEDI